MSNTYFTPEKSGKRFFYVTGRTSDEFFTDGLMQLNIEQLVHMELKEAGYQRVIFFDPNYKLYTYDDESYSLISTNGEELKNGTGRSKSLVRGKQGLRNGKVGAAAKSAVKTGESTEKTVTTEKEPGEEASVNQQVDSHSDWVQGRESGVNVKNIKSGSLSLGMRDDSFVSRQIKAYMLDKGIKTAIVINNADDFPRDNGLDMHSLAATYKRELGHDNENIIVFLYVNEKDKYVNRICKFEIEDNEDANEIEIGDPSSKEVKDMLMYMRYHKNLNFKMSELDSIATSLLQAMILRRTKDSEKGSAAHDFGVFEAFKCLEVLAKEGRSITPELCYTSLGVQKPKTAEEMLNDMIGMNTAKETIMSFRGRYKDLVGVVDGVSRIKPPVEIARKQDEMIHILLTGPQGTGKSTLARLIGRMFYEMGYLKYGHVVETGRNDLVGEHIGETAINTHNRVMEAMGGVLFIDEAYSLVKGDRRENEQDFGMEAINTLVQDMERYKGQFILVAAGYEKNMQRFVNSNPGLPGRFTVRINLEDYTPEEILQILMLMAKKEECVFSEELQAQLPVFCENWVNQSDKTWANGRSVEVLINDLTKRWFNDENRVYADGLKLIERRHFPEDKLEYFRPLEEVRAEMMQELDNMVGLSNVKDKLHRMRRNLSFKRMSKPGHYVFTGNPGTGKTTIARYMGRIMRNFKLLKRGHVVEHTAQELITQYIKNNSDIISVFDEAIDGVLFIDEAYQLKDSHIGESIVDSLLSYSVDHAQDMCIILAGYEDDMYDLLEHNPGLKGRFTEFIHFDSYSGLELHSIMMDILKSSKTKYDENFEENSKRILANYVPELTKSRDFSNVRYLIEHFIPNCEDCMYERVERLYGDEYDETKLVLTGEDFPRELMKYTVHKVKDNDSVSALERINRLMGFDEIKKELESIIGIVKTAKEQDMPHLLSKLSYHWVFEGNPGTGKTKIAQMIGDVYRELGLLHKGNLVIAKRQDLVAEYVGQTAPKTQRKIREAMGGILFIDEAYTLSNGEGGFGQEAIDTILEQMSAHNGEFGVIVAGYPKEMGEFLDSNSGLRSRFNRIFVLEDYTMQQLTDIFASMCADELFVVDEELRKALPSLFERMKNSTANQWANAREAEKLFRQMSSEWASNVVTQVDEEGRKVGVLTLQHIPAEYHDFIPELQGGEIDSKDILAKINEMIGFDEVKESLSEFVYVVNASRKENSPVLTEDLSFHWVLKGNPGTGKTTVANLIGQVYKDLRLLPTNKVIVAKRQDLVGEHVGETAIKTQKKINEAMGGILFIDEAYSLYENMEGGGFGQEAVNTLLEQMSALNGKFGVILAGYPVEMDRLLRMNPGFISRFDKVLELKDYTASEITEIFKIKAKNKGFEPDEALTEMLPNIFDAMKAKTIDGWANGREAERLFRKMKSSWSREPISRTDDKGERSFVLTLKHLPEEYEQYVVQLQNNEIDVNQIMEEINKLIGFKEIKEKLIDFVNIVNAARRENMPKLLNGLSFHWVLKGNPGTGKTTVAKLIGRVYKALGLLPTDKVVIAKRQDLVGRYIGHTAKETQEKINEAMGGILFIDEAYSLVQGSGDNDFGNEAITTILEQMSANNGRFGVIAAGYPAEMDMFLQANPGFKSRFDHEFVLADYTADELIAIFNSMCEEQGFAVDSALGELLPKLFEAMINQKKQDWANGREAENLLRRIKGEWSKHIAFVTDDNGEKKPLITIECLPKDYLNLIEASDEFIREKEETFDTSDMENFSISTEVLADEMGAFFFDKEKEKGMEEHRKGVVYIRAKTAVGISQGSGALISTEGHILTCEHVIHDCKSISVIVKTYGNTPLPISMTYSAKVVWYDEDIDFAILKIECKNCNALEMSEESLAYKGGEGIFMLGYPFGGKVNDDYTNMTASFFAGDIASKQVKNSQIRYLVGMEGKQGCSGAPVFSSSTGKIIGVFCGSQINKGSNITEEVNYCRPVSYVWERVISNDKQS